MFYYWEVIANSENQQSRALHLFIKVQTRASKDALAEILDDRIKVRITAAPIDGKANKHLIQFLAKLFGVPKSSIQIKSGQSSHNKHLILLNPQHLPVSISEQNA